MSDGTIGRRSFLALAAGGLLAGCNRQRRAGPAALPVRATPTRLPRPADRPLFVQPLGDAFVDLKTRAGRLVQQLATYDLDDGTRPDAPLLGLPAARRSSSAAAAAPLRVPGRFSRAEVRFVQLGGLAPVSTAATYASCLVVVEQTLTDRDGATSSVARTVDVRLRRPAREWVVDELASAGGAPLPRPADLPEAARRVLDSPRILLADSARWDIHAGAVDQALLGVMAALAADFTYSVTVLRSGHPRQVVDGRSPEPVSNHYRGRAVDVHDVDGTPVEQLAPARLREFLRAVPDLGGAKEVGTPPGNDLDGRGRQYFSNLVHVDHVHLALDR